MTEAVPALRIRLAHLHDYGWQDRDGGGQPDDPKPEAERQALLHSLLARPGDVLVLRGLGGESALYDLRDALGKQGGDFPHAVHVPGPGPFASIGFLCGKSPGRARDLTGQNFRVGTRTHAPLAGGILVSNEVAGAIWIWNAEGSDPGDDYERRRNEARLLAQALREQINAGQAVLLSLHCREDAQSPMMRMLGEAGLQALLPVDDRGDGWTHRDPQSLNYRRDQWIFASTNLLPRLDAKVIDEPGLRLAGPFRHQVVDVRGR